MLKNRRNVGDFQNKGFQHTIFSCWLWQLLDIQWCSRGEVSEGPRPVAHHHTFYRDLKTRF